jgi:ABC-type nitrate/sulfonate/bicarbonate transport system substrate-binding protein
MRRNLRTLAILVTMVASALFSINAASAQEKEKVRIGLIDRDGSIIVPLFLNEDQELKDRLGLDLELVVYPSVPAYWTGFAAGEVDALIGGYTNFAAMAARGQPVRLVGTYTISDTQFFGKGDKIESAEDLKGKRVAAIVAGAWRISAAQIEQKFGLKAGEDYELIPIPGLLSGVTQVLADTADIAFGWEPDATRVREMHPELNVVLTSSDLRPKGDPFHLQVIGANSGLSATAEQKLLEGYAEIVERINKDPEAAEAEFVKLSGAEPGILAKAIASGRYNFVIRAPSDEDIEAYKDDIELALEPGEVVPDEFYRRD